MLRTDAILLNPKSGTHCPATTPRLVPYALMRSCTAFFSLLCSTDPLFPTPSMAIRCRPRDCPHTERSDSQVDGCCCELILRTAAPVLTEAQRRRAFLARIRYEVAEDGQKLSVGVETMLLRPSDDGQRCADAWGYRETTPMVWLSAGALFNSI